ncbi:GyrI-like domain-containing protein [Flavihumibacter solisilvae]|uniref:AraC family transcriptional regulator n=1 Tax=Flavihumibacter solisilvae TaxID=1349421 RepID=A0A0C1L4J4_9BACT|nr:GyrI-like domain-containing protein [Flavihumibacter solisilvae]KIC94496.1 AraC family transcriptional regulator [Flavihumibacter solisilvae]
MTSAPFRIETLNKKILLGIKLEMSLAQNQTGELWRSFMLRRKEINNAVGKDLYSLQEYGADYFKAFRLENQFVKWAAVEVSDATAIPEAMEALQLQGGLYAVFTYIGSSNDTQIFQYIYSEWLPTSGYDLDDRPHFEVLGEKYKNNSPDSEEEIWIPIKHKHGVQE